MAVGTLLLAGIALAALNTALMGLIAFASDDRELRDLTLWMLGSLSGASWPKVFAVLPFALIVAVVLPGLIRGLNGLLLGEAEAFHLGIDVERTKRLIALAIAILALVAAGAMAMAGEGQPSPWQLGFGHVGSGHMGITDEEVWQRHLDEFRENIWVTVVKESRRTLRRSPGH